MYNEIFYEKLKPKQFKQHLPTKPYPIYSKSFEIKGIKLAYHLESTADKKVNIGIDRHIGCR